MNTLEQYCDIDVQIETAHTHTTQQQHSGGN